MVTGASAGVGRAIAVGFGKRGWQVAVIARGYEGLESAKQEIEATGGKALAIQADVADADALMRAADQVELELGPIDVWVNNAMVTIYANITDIAPEEFHQVTQVTYLGQVYGTLAALETHASAKPRRHHLHRISVSVQIHPLPGSLLRRQSGGPRIRQLAAKRTTL